MRAFAALDKSTYVAVINLWRIATVARVFHKLKDCDVRMCTSLHLGNLNTNKVTRQRVAVCSVEGIGFFDPKRGDPPGVGPWVITANELQYRFRCATSFEPRAEAD